MDVVLRNKKAKNNGIIGESIAKSAFDDFEFLNGLIDARLNGRLAEIKTCSEWQSNGRCRCRGRFVLEEDQHRKLLENDGFYIFIVLMNDGSKRIKLVAAKDVEFKRKISWMKIFG